MRRFSADFGHVLILWQTQPIDRQWISEFVESLEFRCAGESRQGVGGASPLRLAALTRPPHQSPIRFREIGLASGDGRHGDPERLVVAYPRREKIDDRSLFLADRERQENHHSSRGAGAAL